MAYQSSIAPGQNSGSSSSSGFQYVSTNNSPFGDTTFTKVFVGGLAWETQSEILRRYFEQFGEILEAVVINDKNTGRSKGYGFVTFKDPESAKRACADPAPVIDGRRANCNIASLGRPRPALPFGRIISPTPYAGGMPIAREPYVGSYGYQPPVPYSFQQGPMYPSYATPKRLFVFAGMQHMVQNTCIHRAYTILMSDSSFISYMEHLEQLTHLYILTILWAKLLLVVLAIRICRVMRYPVIRLSNLVGQYLLHPFRQFNHHIQQHYQVLVHIFEDHLSLYFLLLHSCMAAVLTKLRVEGFDYSISRLEQD